MSRTVRLTIWPDREIDIDDREYLDLDRRGMILHPQPQPEQAPVPAAAEVSVEQTPAPVATPPASGGRRKRGAGVRPPTTPPALG